MSSQPLHPHAAALLVDFMLSRKGQEIAFRQRRWPAFKELATGGLDDVGNRNTLVPDADKWGQPIPRVDAAFSGAGALACR
jgi:ABC-type Fe3+ transport system substrate-binding protein